MVQTIPKQEYTAEFEQQTLHTWVKAFDADTLYAPGAPKLTAEGMELWRLRNDNARLKREVEILKTTTAYFAQEAP
jgi:transposase